MKKIAPRPAETTCGNCLHHNACAAWNVGSIYSMNATNCTNFESDDNWWHSVKAGNPTKIENEYREPVLYLVCVDGTEQPFRAFFDGENWGDGSRRLDVKYWMPLPQPPRSLSDDWML